MKALRRFAVVLVAALTLCAGALLLSACNKKKSVTLSFETNGGTAIEAVTLEVGSQYEGPQAPTKTGETFGGWYENADLSGNAVTFPITVPDKNTTYYASWANLPKITLVLDGGTLTAGTELSLAAGENVYNFMLNYTPVNDGLQFDGWYVGENKLRETTRMPAAGLTLTARWLVGYTVEIYTEVNGTFQKTDTRTYTDGVYNRELAFTASNAPAVSHYTLSEHDGEVKSIRLAKNANANVFKLYYTPEILSINFSANLPSGVTESDGDTPAVSSAYGTSAQIPECGFIVKGYRFAGWATSAQGNVVFSAGDTLSMSQNRILYAVWDQGYTDRLGGKDIVYISSQDDSVVYLQRDELNEQTGTYDAANGTFSFSVGNKTLSGVVYNNFTFAYLRENEIAGTYKFSNPYYDATHNNTVDATNENITLTVDNYMTAVLKLEDGTEYTGSLASASNGEFSFTYNNGEKNVSEAIRLLEDASGERTGYFQRRGTEAATFYPFTVTSATLQGSVDQNTRYTLDGYGNVTMSTASGTLNGIYFEKPAETDDDETTFPVYQLIFLTAKNNVMRTREVILNRTNGQNAVNIMLFKDHASALTRTNNGETLELDGFNGLRKAVYTNNFGPLTGQYAVVSSLLYPNDTIVHFRSESGTTEYFFRLTNDSFETIGTSGYTESRYMLYNGEANEIQLSNLVLTQNTRTGDAKLFYAADSNSSYELFATGTYSSASDLGLGTLFRFDVNSTGFLSENTLITRNFVFGIQNQIALTNGSYIQGFYVYGFIQTVNGQQSVTEARYKTYTDDNGNRIITNEIYFGASYFSAQGTSFTARWTESVDAGPFNQHLLRLITSQGSLYFSLSETTDKGGKFTELSSPFLYHYQYDPITRTPSAARVLFFSGDGRVVLEENNEETGELVRIAEGEYTVDDQSIATLKFTNILVEGKVSTEERVFVGRITSGSNTIQVVLWHDDETPETITSNGEGTFTLDGFQTATLRTNANTQTGTYRFATADKDVLYFTVSNTTTAYDITKNGGNWTFTRQIAETPLDGKQGTYYFYGYSCGAIDESSSILYGKVDQTKFLVLDGKGGAVYTKNGTEYQGTYVTESGATTVILADCDESELTVALNPRAVSVQGIYVVLQSDFAELYFDSAWQVLSISNTNSAYFVDEFGFRYTGIYAFRSENYVYIKTNGGVGTGLYRIDRENHSFTPASPDNDGFVIDGTKLVKYIGEAKAVTLPATVTTVASDAFVGTNVVSVDLANVEIIENLAFYDVKTLASVTGAKVREIGQNAFARTPVATDGEGNPTETSATLHLNLTNTDGNVTRLGVNLFTNVDYAIVVETLAIAQTLYSETDWEAYHAGIALKESVANSANHGVWYAPDFSVVVLGANADANDFHGVYTVDGTTVTIYQGAGNSTTLTLSADGKTITYDSKTFTKFTVGTPVTLTTADGASLTFTPTGKASFTVSGKYKANATAEEENVSVSVSYAKVRGNGDNLVDRPFFVTFLRNNTYTYGVTVSSLTTMTATYQDYSVDWFTEAVWMSFLGGGSGNYDSVTLIRTSYEGSFTANGTLESIVTANANRDALYFEGAETVYLGTSTYRNQSAQTYRITVDNSKSYTIEGNGGEPISYEGDGRIYVITVYCYNANFSLISLPAFAFEWYSYSEEDSDNSKLTASNDAKYSVKSYYYLDGTLTTTEGDAVERDTLITFAVFKNDQQLTFNELRAYSGNRYLGVILDGENAGRYTITLTLDASGNTITEVTVEKAPLLSVQSSDKTVTIIYSTDIDGNITGVYRVSENGKTLNVFQVLWRDSTHTQLLVFCSSTQVDQNGNVVRDENGNAIVDTRRFIVHVTNADNAAPTATEVEILPDIKTATTTDESNKDRFQADVLLDRDNKVVAVWISIQNADKDGYGPQTYLSAAAIENNVYTYRVYLTEIDGRVNTYEVTVTISNGTPTLTVELA